jgi:hypothetical protein
MCVESMLWLLNLHKSEENNKMQGYFSGVMRFVKSLFSRSNSSANTESGGIDCSDGGSGEAR